MKKNININNIVRIALDLIVGSIAIALYIFIGVMPAVAYAFLLILFRLSDIQYNLYDLNEKMKRLEHEEWRKKYRKQM